MATPLLRTKLHIPPVRPNLVPRPRLVQRLDEGLRLGRKLTLVSAPAGYGKTTLLSEWASDCRLWTADCGLAANGDQIRDPKSSGDIRADFGQDGLSQAGTDAVHGNDVHADNTEQLLAGASGGLVSGDSLAGPAAGETQALGRRRIVNAESTKSSVTDCDETRSFITVPSQEASH